MNEWIKTELKTYWGRILLVILAIGILFHFAQDVKSFLNKDRSTVIQSQSAPVNLSMDGIKLPSPPPVYVNVNPVVTEQATATVTKKVDPKTDPDVVVTDSPPTYKLRYNGKEFTWVNPVQEDYKFQNGMMTLNRTSNINVNVELPTPIYSIGLGINSERKPAISGTYRIGKTPFNVWGYVSNKDQAVGLNFTQYSTTGGTK